MSEVVETFEDMTPIEAEPISQAGQTSDPNLDTFDNMEVIEELPKEESKGEKEDEQELKDKQINQLEDSKDEKKAEKDEKAEDESGKTEKDDADGGPEEDKPDTEEKQDGPKIKLLKGRVGEDSVEINPETELKVKVAGKREAVSVQDLINNFSGQKNWDKEYTKLGEEKKTFEAENTQYKQELGWLQGNIKEVVNILDDNERNPVDALMHLVDVTNRNPVQFQMKLFKHIQSQVEEMGEMDEVEQELYWERQKNQYLSKRQESLTSKANSDNEARSLRAKVDGLRESQGVSEEQFMEAHSELEELGFEEVTPEQAVNYATIKPHLDVAESLVGPFEEDMTTDGADKLISDIANYLKSGEFTEKEIRDMLKEEYSSSDEIDDLEKKVKNFSENETASTKKVAGRGEDAVESFDDFDEYSSQREFNY